MRDSWLEQFSRFMARVVPDAITASLILTIVVAAGAVALGNSALQVMDAYYRGFWMLLTLWAACAGDWGVWRRAVVRDWLPLIGVLFVCVMSIFWQGHAE